MPNFVSRFTTENILAGSLLFLCVGVFLGNTFIAIGQGLLVIGIVSGYVRKEEVRWNWKRLRPSSWFLVAVTVVSFISIIGNLDTISDPLQFVKKLRYHSIAIVLLLLSSIREGSLFSESRRNLYTAVWFAVLVMAVVVGLAEVFDILGRDEGKGSQSPERLSGFYGQVMTFANILQFSVIALFVFLIRPELFRSFTRIRWFIVIPVLLVASIGLYLSFTRSAVLGAIVGVAIASLYRSRWMILPFAALAVLVGAVSYKQDTRYFEFGPVHRITHWQGAALTFAQYPVLGVGYRNYEIRSAEIKEELGLPRDQKFKKQNNAENGYLRRHAHNNFLEAFASTGVFGGIAFLGFCICWTREAWRSRYGFLFVPMIAAFLVSGLFENTFFDSEVLNCIFLIYFLSQIVFDREDQPSAGMITMET